MHETDLNSTWGPDYIAIIADMVGSREISPDERPQVQHRFAALVDSLNQTFPSQLKARFIITLGDEFQGILHIPTMIPDLLWHIESNFSDKPLRLGIGLGPISTDIPEYAINVDGPALHQARRAIDIAKKDQRMGGVFSGFGSRQDKILNGIARLLWVQRQRWTMSMRRDLSLLRTPMTQTAAAKLLGVSKQAVHDSVERSFWNDYLEGEQALTTMLQTISPAPEEP